MFNYWFIDYRIDPNQAIQPILNLIDIKSKWFAGFFWFGNNPLWLERLSLSLQFGNNLPQFELFDIQEPLRLIFALSLSLQ